MITFVRPPLEFHGRLLGALAPFVLFLAGVAWLALSGAPDEKGFWPILLAALALGLVLARDRTQYSETVIAAMGQPVVMLMIMAWLLSGVLGIVLNESGFVQALVWGARMLHLTGAAYVGAAFLVCSIVSTSTGTSFGTIMLAGPLLYTVDPFDMVGRPSVRKMITKGRPSCRPGRNASALLRASSIAVPPMGFNSLMKSLALSRLDSFARTSLSNNGSTSVENRMISKRSSSFRFSTQN